MQNVTRRGPGACTGLSSECGWTSGHAQSITQKGTHAYNTGTV